METSRTFTTTRNASSIQREALNGNIEVVKKMVAELPEHQKKDTITMLERSVAEHGRTLELK